MQLPVSAAPISSLSQAREARPLQLPKVPRQSKRPQVPNVIQDSTPCPDFSFPEEPSTSETDESTRESEALGIIIRDDVDFYSDNNGTFGLGYLDNQILASYQDHTTSLDDVRPLAKDECIEFYDLIDAHLDPDHGFQEGADDLRTLGSTNPHLVSDPLLEHYVPAQGDGSVGNSHPQEPIFSDAGMDDVDFCSWMFPVEDVQTRSSGEISLVHDEVYNTPENKLSNSDVTWSESSIENSEDHKIVKTTRRITEKIEHSPDTYNQSPATDNDYCNLPLPENGDINVVQRISQNTRPARPRTFSAGGGI